MLPDTRTRKKRHRYKLPAEPLRYSPTPHLWAICNWGRWDTNHAVCRHCDILWPAVIDKCPGEARQHPNLEALQAGVRRWQRSNPVQQARTRTEAGTWGPRPRAWPAEADQASAD